MVPDQPQRHDPAYRIVAPEPCALRGRRGAYHVCPMIPLASRVAEVADSITLAVTAKARAMKASASAAERVMPT